VEICADCQVELVEKLEEIVAYSKLAILPLPEVEKAVEYLKYSNIKDIKITETETQGEIFVNDTEYQEALKYFRTYARESFTDEEADEVNKELAYESEEYDADNKAKDIKSSAYSFTMVGALIGVFSLLNLMDVLSVLANDFYSIVFLIAGVSLTGVGIYSFTKIKDYTNKADDFNKVIEEMIKGYKEKHEIERFFQEKAINKEDYDEGSLYFVVIDLLKEALKIDFPEQEEKIINTVAERIYTEIIETK
jgi:predicted negative regulator of RcsB-dependent stress response